MEILIYGELTLISCGYYLFLYYPKKNIKIKKNNY
jgi:hypothetical protein